VDWFESIYLEDDQRDLLLWMVESEQRLPKEKHDNFLFLRTSGPDLLIHPAIPERTNIRGGDLEVLADEGLLRRGYTPSGGLTYENTPQGRRYCAEMRIRAGQPVEVVEQEVRRYLDGERFQARFPAAHARWLDAERALWDAQGDRQLTDIGHVCREAMQEFSSELLTLTGTQPPPGDAHAKTINRVRAALGGLDLGERRSALLDSLITYWEAVNGVVQRLEHGAQKGGDPVEWDDARQAVFQTLIIMIEIDRVIGQ
jgi:hypothetical protein